MKKILSSIILIISIASSVYAIPSLEIKGSNYELVSLVKGTKVFSNRPAMLLKDIPVDYTGWKFTQINANSTYLPGPLPSFQIKPNENGFLYAMVANVEKPDVCSQWAVNNGWTLIPNQKLYYGDTESQAFSFYKKACVKDQWINIVQPQTFSGAVIIAPNIVEETNVIPAVPVTIQATGWLETDILNNGTLAYSNRTYVFGGVQSSLKGLVFTRYNGGTPPKLKITAAQTGDMYIAISNYETVYNGTTNGWTKVAGLEFTYNDNVTTTFSIYKKPVVEGDIISIETTSWQGVLVIAPRIDFSLISDFTPPPGVVIHNSKAITKKFIGSPSIVVLEDGTYIASHDYFGTRTQTFVYKSLDKGKTWSEISTIFDLKWATIFRRSNEVYLIGVRVNGTEYGNTVILKSVDGGVTWTDPADKKTGLLLQGYYHCAPVPVVKYNGKYWRAMEDKGEAGGAWGNFKAFMMSIDENSDMLDADNWTISNKLTFDPGPDNYGNAWLEGNAVVARDGSVKDILRVNYSSDNIAAVIDISADGKTANFNSTTGFVPLPGALKKFTIRYDSVSDKYWTLSNYVLPEDVSGNNLERVRNTIALCWSSDLKDWKVKDILLHHPNISNHGFQYLDWLFEGNDIIAVSRTAWEDETGSADSQHNANYITFHRLKNFRYESINTEPAVKVKKWKDGASSAIALTFDDGFKAHYNYVYPILQQYNIQGTFFINSSNLVNRGQTQKERYGMWEDFKEMAQHGQEIASHSLSHANLTTADYSNLVNELKNDKENIETNIGEPCLTHAYPFCLHNESVDNVASTLFIAGRQCGELSNNSTLTASDWYSVNSDLLTWINPRSLDNENISISNFKAKIQNEIITTEKFGVACIHEVLPYNLLSTLSGYEIATTEWLTEICKYIDEKRTSGDIWPTTFSNIARYAQERDNLKIQKRELTDGSFRYDFGDVLDDSIFNVPITIEIDLPQDWNNVSCSILENDNLISKTDYPKTQGKISLNITPDKSSVIFSNTDQTGIKQNEHIKLNIFPNPVKNILNISAGDYFEGDYVLFDAQGRMLNQRSICIFAGESYSLNVSNLAKGFYIVKLKAKNGYCYFQKIQKND